MTDLGTLGGTLVAMDAAQCVNNRGQVAGVSTLSGDQIVHPFLWDHGVLTDLGTLGGDFTITTWLNDAGEVVGGTTTAGEAEFHAALWRDGAITDLGTLEGDCFSLAHAVNSSGQIVGESGSCFIALRAFLWDEGRIVDLNTLIPANSSLQLVVAVNINDKGEIAGTGTPPGCADYLECGHVFLLIPCDENHGGIEGCDYSLVDDNPTSGMQTAAAAKELSPDAIRQLMQAAGRRSKPWYRGFGAQPPK
jgi:probable HAF family extracellular repeat protein